MPGGLRHQRTAADMSADGDESRREPFEPVGRFGLDLGQHPARQRTRQSESLFPRSHGGWAGAKERLFAPLERAEHPDRLEASGELVVGFSPAALRNGPVRAGWPAEFATHSVPKKGGRWPVTPSSVIPGPTRETSPSSS